MASALYLTLFCVFQVMSALTHVLAAPPNLTAGTQISSASIMPGFNQEEQDRHDKRSLNIWPYDEKYLSTSHYTLEVQKNGNITATSELKPIFGVLRFFTACSIASTTTRGPIRFQDAASQGKIGVSIKGMKAEKFVCMDSNGVLYGSDKCTDECRFQQDPIGDGSHFRYYSLKYRGFIGNPKRNKKRWYIGIKRTRAGVRVLKGHQSKKNKKKETHLIPRPVTNTMPDPRYSGVTITTQTVATDAGEPDNSGKVTVITSPDSTEKARPRRPDRRGTKCDEKDPLNLFRFSRCPNGKRDRDSPRARPFSRSKLNVRHSGSKRKKSRGSSRSSASRDRQGSRDLNLFSIPKR